MTQFVHSRAVPRRGGVAVQAQGQRDLFERQASDVAQHNYLSLASRQRRQSRSRIDSSNSLARRWRIPGACVPSLPRLISPERTQLVRGLAPSQRDEVCHRIGHGGDIGPSRREQPEQRPLHGVLGGLMIPHHAPRKRHKPPSQALEEQPGRRLVAFVRVQEKLTVG